MIIIQFKLEYNLKGVIKLSLEIKEDDLNDKGWRYKRLYSLNWEIRWKNWKIADYVKKYPENRALNEI